MGDIVSFNRFRRKKGKNKPSVAVPFDDPIEERLVATIAPDAETLKKQLLGTSLEDPATKEGLKKFFFNLFVQKIKKVKEHFLAFSYLSQLLSDPKAVFFTYAVDLIAAKKEGKNITDKEIADNCFVIASLWPDWLNRKGNSMKRSDYLSLSSTYYHNEAVKRLDGSRPLFEDLSKNVWEYSEVVLSSRDVLVFR